MQGHRVRHHEGLQNVGLDLLNDQDDHQHDDRLRQATINGRDQHRDHARGQSTEDRNEGSKERDDTNRDGQRYAQEERAQGDADRVDGRHLNLRTHVRAECRPSADRALVDGDARGGGQQAHAPQPDRAPLLQEEEQAEQHRQAGRGQRAHRGGDVQGTSRQRFLVRVEPVDQLGPQLFSRGRQDGRINLEGAILQELVVQDRIEQGAETIRGLRRQLRDLLNEFGGRLAQRAGDGREEDE